MTKLLSEVVDEVARRKPLTVSQEYLEGLIQESSDQTFPGLGSHVGIWNGGTPAAGRRTICGSDVKVSPNNVLVNLPLVDESDERLYGADVMDAVFRAVVEEWDPDWAVFASREMRERQGGYTGKPVAVCVRWVC